MKLRPHRKASPELSLAPLIDVVFLLLIFFMVSTTFDKEGGLKLDLPDSTSRQVAPPEEQRIDIRIDAQGNLMVEDRRLLDNDVNSLRRRLERISNGNTQLAVAIRADAKTPHRYVVRALDAASQAGLKRISIPTRLTESASRN